MADTSEQTLSRLAAERNAEISGSPGTQSTTSQSGWLSFLGTALGIGGNIIASDRRADQQADVLKQQAKLANAQQSASRPLVIGLLALAGAGVLIFVLFAMRKGR